MNRTIDYSEILKNVEQMIELLEFDSMRSAGKTKLNSQHLHSLYELKDRYEEKLASASKNKSAKAQDATATRKKAEAVAEE